MSRQQPALFGILQDLPLRLHHVELSGDDRVPQQREPSLHSEQHQRHGFTTIDPLEEAISALEFYMLKFDPSQASGEEAQSQRPAGRLDPALLYLIRQVVKEAKVLIGEHRKRAMQEVAETLQKW